jgi:hypothetical protein
MVVNAKIMAIYEKNNTHSTFVNAGNTITTMLSHYKTAS